MNNNDSPHELIWNRIESMQKTINELKKELKS